MIKVPLIDLPGQVRPFKARILKDWALILERGAYINGPHGKAFEAELAAYLGARFVVGCNSGTDALVLSLRALGVGPGHSVLVPAFSFFATAEAVSLVGARPVFCDILPDSFLLDPEDALRRLTPDCRAAIPVHLFGRVFDVAGFRARLKAAGRPDLRILEDGCQSLGAELKGRKAGALGDAAAISFYPTKNLAAAGDAGALATDDADLAALARRLREHGMPRRYEHTEIGYNSRLDELQAAVLRRKLPKLDVWTRRRRELATAYARVLKGLPLGLPAQAAGDCWHQYTVRVPGGRRDALRDHLAAAGIGTSVFYPVCMHQQAPYAAGAPALPVAEAAAREVLSLPMFPGLTAAQMRAVGAAVRGFYAGR